MSPGACGSCSPKACSNQFYRKRKDRGRPCLQAKLDEETQAPQGPPQAAHAVPPATRAQSRLHCQTTASVAAEGHTTAGPRPCPATSVHEACPATVSIPTSFLCCLPRFAVLPAFWEPRVWGGGAVEKLRALLQIHLARPQQELFQDTGDSQCSWVLAPVKTQGPKLLSRGPRTRTPGPRGVRCRAGGPARLAGGRGTLGRRGKEGSSRALDHPWGLRGPGELAYPEEPMRA